MHVSNEYSELVDEEVFPVQITKQTYRYVQRLLKESGENNNRRLAVKENGSLYRYGDDPVYTGIGTGKHPISGE